MGSSSPASSVSGENAIVEEFSQRAEENSPGAVPRGKLDSIRRETSNKSSVFKDSRRNAGGEENHETRGKQNYPQADYTGL